MINLKEVKPLNTVFWVIWEADYCEPEWLPAIYLGEDEGKHFIRVFTTYVVGEDPSPVLEEIAICTRKKDFYLWLEQEGRMDYPLNLEEYIFNHDSTRKPTDLTKCFHKEKEAMECCLLLRKKRLWDLFDFSKDKVGKLPFEKEGVSYG